VLLIELLLCLRLSRVEDNSLAISDSDHCSQESCEILSFIDNHNVIIYMP
jgi:hypothetical protein